MLTRKAKTRVKHIPPPELKRGPEKIPRHPSFKMLSSTPFAIFAPNPINGRVTPHPKESLKGSKAPTAYKKTPKQTKKTSILAGVREVKSIKSWAKKHKNPPIKKE